MAQKKILWLFASFVIIVYALSFISAVIVDADFVTIYPGKSGTINIDVENNEDFDIEYITLGLDLENVPFTSIGSSIEEIDDIRDGDDDSASFTLRASTDIIPGDYNIPYTLKYTNADNNNETFEKQGSFGLRVSAETDLDFSAETNGDAVIGQEGQVTLEIVNRGLGEIKSVSVEILPQGFELLSKDKIFVGSIDSDDSDTASFDVVYNSQNPVLSARISYKDFDNQDQVQIVNLPLKVYTKEKAFELGLIDKPSYTFYIIVAIIIIAYIFYRIRKRRKKKLRR